MKTNVLIKVRNYHLDRFGHVNNARYLEFLEEGRWTYSEKNHLLKVFEKEQISHAAVNININYKKSAVDGDRLIVETALGKKGDKSITFHQRILLQETGEIISDASVTNVYLDRDGNIMTTGEMERFWEDLTRHEPLQEI